MGLPKKKECHCFDKKTVDNADKNKIELFKQTILEKLKKDPALIKKAAQIIEEMISKK